MKTINLSVTSIKNYLFIFSILSATALFTACGGGDDSTPADPEITVTTPLSGLEVTPATNTTAKGQAMIIVNKDTGAISGSLEISNISSEPDKAHIHSGGVGINSGIVVTLTRTSYDDTDNTATFEIPADEILSAENLELLLDGETYFQVHSKNIPTGEIRGQVLPDTADVTRYAVNLGGQQVAPPVTTAGTGKAVLLINTQTGALTGGITLSNITDDSDQPDATKAHIHTGTAGNNGGVLVTLEQNATDKNLFTFAAGAALGEGDIAKLENDELYFQVHSGDVPTGEIRGQITDSPLQATLTSIQDNILTGTCTTAGCHNATSKAAGMMLDSVDNSFASLVGQNSDTYTTDGSTPYVRVKALEPDNSLLVKKLNGDDGVGNQMPLGKTPLSAYEIAIIRQWILDGANK